MEILLAILMIVCHQSGHLNVDQCVSYTDKCVRYHYEQRINVEPTDPTFAANVFYKCTEDIQE